MKPRADETERTDVSYETILVSRSERVGTITLNRPEALNALNSQVMAEVTAAAAEFDGDPGIGAIVITGSAKAFAAGADIKEMASLSFSEVFESDFFAAWGRLAAVRTPLIAAVGGYALGGGCELAMMCDVLIAADTAKFGQPEIKLGVLPGMGGSQRLTRAIGKAKASKPVPLGLPHPYMSLETAEICLITKDPQREYKDKLAALGVRAKVIGVSKLKKKHKEYEAKRALLRAYEVFLADARVLPMLPPLLGKGFFVKRKLPVAVDLTKKDLRGELEKGVCSALYRHGAGTSNSMQVGTCVQTPAQLVENVVAAVEQAVRLIPGKWSNVQSLSLRTTNSVALPFYNSMPHE